MEVESKLYIRSVKEMIKFLGLNDLVEEDLQILQENKSVKILPKLNFLMYKENEVESLIDDLDLDYYTWNFENFLYLSICGLTDDVAGFLFENVTTEYNNQTITVDKWFVSEDDVFDIVKGCYSEDELKMDFYNNPDENDFIESIRGTAEALAETTFNMEVEEGTIIF